MAKLEYQEKDGNAYKGGPSYYIAKGLNNKKLAAIYSILIILWQGILPISK